MIKKLRRKFILVAMVSVSCVLLVMMAAINIWNYCKINTYADGVLDLLYANGGRFSLPEGDTQPSDTPPTESGKNPLTRPVPPRKDMNAETPYETRYFTVRYENGEAQVDVRNIAAVSSEEAVTLAEAAVAGNKTRGYAGIYRFLVADDGAFVLFVDCARQMQTAKNFLESSLLFSGAGLAAVLILVLILSKYAVRPIAESYEKQKHFITDASHELKTPLTIISANNEITELTLGRSQATETISRQVDKMTVMIKNLTTLARLDETEKPSEQVDFSVTDTLIDLVALFRPSIESGDRSFTAETAQDLTMRGDETLVRQALSILLENAAKYAESKVELTAVKNGKNILLTLTNDASHVKCGNLDRCFERFYRTDEARASAVSGNGIGLSIAKSIVELHGGRISAAAPADGVFRITVRFPIEK